MYVSLLLLQCDKEISSPSLLCLISTILRIVYSITKSGDSSFDTVTKLLAGLPRNRGSIPVKGNIFLCTHTKARQIPVDILMDIGCELAEV
jgi:hypothetical protein